MVNDYWAVRCDNHFFQLQRHGRYYPPNQGKVLVCEGRHGQITGDSRAGKPSVRVVPQEAHRGPKTVPRKRKGIPFSHHGGSLGRVGAFCAGRVDFGGYVVASLAGGYRAIGVRGRGNEGRIDFWCKVHQKPWSK